MPDDCRFQTLAPFGDPILPFRLRATANVRAGRLAARFEISGDLAGIVFPGPSSAPARCDLLWQRTCFEVFVNPAPGEAYWEFNFSPSGDWACYRFDSYRSGMSPEQTAVIAERAVNSPTSALREWEFSADVTALPEIAVPLRFGLAAVVETESGEITYWAASHRGGKADFHSRESFTLIQP